MKTHPYADPGTPDLRSPTRFLVWIAKGQWRTQTLAVIWATVWMGTQAFVPAAVGRAVDQGLVHGDGSRLLLWGGALLALAAAAALSGALRHRYTVEAWLRSAFRCVQLIGHKGADTGAALPRTLSAGEVVATVASDAMRLGGLYEASAQLVGAIAGYVVVAVVLVTASPPLGLLVIVGVPLLMGALAFVVRPLQRRQAAQREEAGKLTTLGADTVAGLRVLRGIGGEQTFLRRYEAQSQRVRTSGVHVAGVQAALDASQVLLPGIFMVLVTWIGARFALDGTITPGQLVAFYGYAAFLVLPLRIATGFADRATRAYIGARKIITVLEVQPDIVDEGRHTAELPFTDMVLADPVSGAEIPPGLFTAVVSARPAESVALADRLGSFGPVPTPVTAGGTALAEVALAEVRSRIVVSETDPRLFSGTLRDELDPRGSHRDEQILEALTTASGEDVLVALPDGLDSDVEERGRSFSGGQRQRLALTRALLTDAPTLVLVEPTSAVDAHTEARVAARLRHARTGRTTVVVSASPLVLDQADHVVFLADGVVAAQGRHHELMASCPVYRRTVVRGEDD
jgi:ABC-type multidrug transport system fused ATPase/permease subunit